MVDTLRANIVRLSVLDVQVRFDVSDEDLVARLYSANDPRTVIDGMDISRRESVIRQLESLASQDMSAVRGKQFFVGAVDPCVLNAAVDYDSFFKLVLPDCTTVEEYAKVFQTRFSLQIGSGWNVLEKLKGESEKMKDSYRRGDTSKFWKSAEEGRNSIDTMLGLSPEAKRETYELLCIVRDDFIACGEAISYTRLELLVPYLSALLQRPADKRHVVLGKILRREYPFTDDNKEVWNSEIMSA